MRSTLDQNNASPTPPEQLDNLIIWLGNAQADPGSAVEFTPRMISAAGAVDETGLGFIVSQAVNRGLIEAQVNRAGFPGDSIS